MRKLLLLTGLGTLLMLVLTACGAEAETSQAPEFTLQSAEGEEVSLSDFDGQPVLLYFHMAVG